MDTKLFFTDGSVLPLQGCGGYAAVPMQQDGLPDTDHIITGSKFSRDSQEMELLALLAAIRAVPKHQPVLIYTDCKTACDVLARTERADCERRRHHRLWNQLRQLRTTRDVTLCWVKAHSGVLGNEIADVAARTAARAFAASTASRASTLIQGSLTGQSANDSNGSNDSSSLLPIN